MRIRTGVFLACLCIALVGLGATTASAGQVDVANSSVFSCPPVPWTTVATNGTVTMSVSREVCGTPPSGYALTFLYSVSFLSSTVPGAQFSVLGFSAPPGDPLEFNPNLDYGLVLGSTVGLTSSDIQVNGGGGVAITGFQVGDTLTFYLQSFSNAPVVLGDLDIYAGAGGYLSVPVLVPVPEAPPAVLLGIGLLMSGLMLGFNPRWRTVA
jgi:hypothetical protein